MRCNISRMQILKNILLQIIDCPQTNSLLQKIFRNIDEHRARIMKIANNQKYNAVLDFGCGEGLFCTAFAYDKYFGYDFNKDKIKYAQKKEPNYIFGSTLPNDIGEYDLILFNNVLHHLPIEKLGIILDSLFKVDLKKPRLLLFEVYPSFMQRALFLKAVLLLEALIHYSKPQVPQNWINLISTSKQYNVYFYDYIGFYCLDFQPC